MPPELLELVAAAGVIGTIAIILAFPTANAINAAVVVWQKRQLVEIDIDATQHNIGRLEITSDERYKALVVDYDKRVEELREARTNVSSLGEAKTEVEAQLRRAVDDNTKLGEDIDTALAARDEALRAAELAITDCVALAEDYERRLAAQKAEYEQQLITLRADNAVLRSMVEKRDDDA